MQRIRKMVCLTLNSLLLMLVLFTVSACTPRITVNGRPLDEEPVVYKSTRPDDSISLNYNKPDNEFISADVKLMAGGFLSDYTGKYVIFKGNFVANGGQSAKTYYGQTSDLCGLTLSANINNKPIPTLLPTVYYFCKDKEMKRSLVGTSTNDIITIYAYVLPRNTKLNSMQKDDFTRLSEDYMFLVKVVPQ